MFIVKDIHECNLEDLLDICRRVGSCPYIRLLHDTVPGHSMFVYKYLKGHLLSLARKYLPLALVKRILKDSLRGLAALHDQDIVRNGKSSEPLLCIRIFGNNEYAIDVKANNIVIDWEEGCDGIKIAEVQLTDLEDSLHLGTEFDICDLLVGNQIWRSPEAHAKARVNKPSDMFSFGIVVSCQSFYSFLSLGVNPH